MRLKIGSVPGVIKRLYIGMPGAVLTVFEYWACDLNVSGARNAMSSYYGCTEKKNSSQYVHWEPILLFRFPSFKNGINKKTVQN